MEDINKKIEEFENKYGMCELSVDDLENVGGGAGIGLNSQDSVGSFCAKHLPHRTDYRPYYRSNSQARPACLIIPY